MELFTLWTIMTVLLFFENRFFPTLPQVKRKMYYFQLSSLERHVVISSLNMAILSQNMKMLVSPKFHEGGMVEIMQHSL